MKTTLHLYAALIELHPRGWKDRTARGHPDRSDPRLPALIRAAERRRALARQMAELRQAQEKSQTVIGAAIGTSQSAIARLESGDADTRFSTLERYAAGLGYEIEYKLVPSSRRASS